MMSQPVRSSQGGHGREDWISFSPVWGMPLDWETYGGFHISATVMEVVSQNQL